MTFEVGGKAALKFLAEKERIEKLDRNSREYKERMEFFAKCKKTHDQIEKNSGREYILKSKVEKQRKERDEKLIKALVAWFRNDVDVEEVLEFDEGLEHEFRKVFAEVEKEVDK